jgi:hypothetical protein
VTRLSSLLCSAGLMVVLIRRRRLRGFHEAGASVMIEGLIGAQLLNVSAIVALRLMSTQSDGHPASSRSLDCVLIPGGALAGFLAMVWFLDNILGWFGLVFWLLSCIAFAMGIWPVEERARSLLGLGSLIAGAVLLFIANWEGFPVPRHPDPLPARTQSFCPGCGRAPLSTRL